MLFVFQPHDLEDLRNNLHDLRVRDTGYLQREGNVLKECLLGQELEILKYDTNLTPEQRNIFQTNVRNVPITNNHSTFTWVLFSDNHFRECGLTRSRLPYNRNKLT